MSKELSFSDWWTPLRIQVLYLVFEGQQSLAAIGRGLDIPLGTIKDWVSTPTFKEKLEELRANLAEELSSVPYIRKESRLIALSQLAQEALKEWENRRYLIEQRPVPGGMLTNEKLNRDAADIFRNALTDIAAELGQRKGGAELGNVNAAPAVVINQAVITEELIARYLKAGGAMNPQAEDEEDGSVVSALPAPAEEKED